MAFLVLSLLFILFNLSSAATVSYNVQTLGAKADGKTDATEYFLSAWTTACASAKPAQVYVPPGRYLLRNPLVFSGKNCKNTMVMRMDGILVAPSDYNVIGNAENWIKFERVNGLAISGGTLDAQGAGLWNCKASGRSCPRGATVCSFENALVYNFP